MQCSLYRGSESYTLGHAVSILWCAGRITAYCDVHGASLHTVMCMAHHCILWCAGRITAYCDVQGVSLHTVMCRVYHCILWCAGRITAYCDVYGGASLHTVMCRGITAYGYTPCKQLPRLDGNIYYYIILLIITNFCQCNTEYYVNSVLQSAEEEERDELIGRCFLEKLIGFKTCITIIRTIKKPRSWSFQRNSTILLRN